jgi:hypothetical protein
LFKGFSIKSAESHDEGAEFVTHSGYHVVDGPEGFDLRTCYDENLMLSRSKARRLAPFSVFEVEVKSVDVQSDGRDTDASGSATPSRDHG